jgi:hypothetical protein
VNDGGGVVTVATAKLISLVSTIENEDGEGVIRQVRTGVRDRS